MVDQGTGVRESFRPTPEFGQPQMKAVFVLLFSWLSALSGCHWSNTHLLRQWGATSAREPAPLMFQGAPLSEVTAYVSGLSGQTLYARIPLDQRVTLMSEEPVPRGLILEPFGSLLALKGFALRETNQGLEIVRSDASLPMPREAASHLASTVVTERPGGFVPLLRYAVRLVLAWTWVFLCLAAVLGLSVLLYWGYPTPSSPARRGLRQK